MINNEKKSTSQYKSIKKFESHIKSVVFGYFFATVVIMAVMMIDLIVIVLFELKDIPERNELLIPPILLLIALISFGIGLVYIIKFTEKKGMHQLYNKTILISFIICFIIYIIAFWVLWP